MILSLSLSLSLSFSLILSVAEALYNVLQQKMSRAYVEIEDRTYELRDAFAKHRSIQQVNISWNFESHKLV